MKDRFGRIDLVRAVHKKITLLVMPIVLSGLAEAAVVDSIQFGRQESEQAHQLKSAFSEVVDGTLGVPGRRLLPRDEPYWRGGNMTFEMAVDPDKPNYVTAKFWGGYFDAEGHSCRLMLFIDGKQVGQRHLGEVDQLDVAHDQPRFDGRFFYKTLPLPLHLTQGRTSVELAIEAQGHVNGYGSGFEDFQAVVTVPSRGIYRIYTHTDACFVPDADEVQGKPVAAPPIRTVDDSAIMEQVKARVNATVTDLIERKGGRYSQDELSFMARAYHEPWTTGFQSKKLLDQVVLGVDYQYRQFDAGNSPRRGAKSWAQFGLTADAVRLLEKEIQPYLNKPVDRTATVRKKAWEQMFETSRNDRITRRRAYTNQSMITDVFGIYLSNRGLQAMGSSNAWSETKARTVLYESVGLEPWRGSWESPAGNPSYSYGKDHYIFTPTGLSRELGYVGGYGEVTDWACKLYDATRPAYGEEGDPKIKAQLMKIAKARAPFRYPGIDQDGNRAMRLEGVIGWRDWKFPGDIVYDQVASRESMPFEAAVYTMDPELIGYAQHMLEDNQYFKSLEKIMKDTRIQATAVLMGAPHAYEMITHFPQQPTRLPMAVGQPDTVFTDPMNGVVALKNGDEVLYVSLYWRARYAVNFLARIHHITPSIMRDATVWEEVQLNESGDVFVIPDQLNASFNTKFERNYRDGGLGMSLADAGLKQPIAKVPDDVQGYEIGQENVYAGKGEFYLLEYGNYLIAMNCSKHKPYAFDVPSAFSGAKDLVSGQVPKGSNVRVQPQQTIVLYKTVH